MIVIERSSVMNFENAIRGARNPMNSWDRMDSYTEADGTFVLGENDLSLAKRLCNAGSDHRKFVRQIFVSVDLTAPLYWWKEYDTYKVGTVANSCSTMHKIHAKEFDINDFSHERMSGGALVALTSVIVPQLNEDRRNFIDTNDKQYWHNMIQLLPTSYNQKRTVQLNYAVLRNMYHSRKNHKLDEWRNFCEWVETLPYAELITDGGSNND